MITLRAHAISLAAVFLALAIGVALGSGLLSNTVLSGLRDDKRDLQNQIDTLTDDKNRLNQKLSAASEFDARWRRASSLARSRTSRWWCSAPPTPLMVTSRP